MIGYIVIGLLAGAIAKAILPGTQGGGWIATIILGIVGAFIGGIVSDLVTSGKPAIWSLPGLIWAVIGSLIVLVIWGFLTKKKA